VSAPRIGVIGGTGLDTHCVLDGLMADLKPDAIDVSTPFGKPSGPLLRADWQGCEVVFVNRHGVGHRHSPSAVPYRANIYALKSLGVDAILASGATGSLRREIAPGDLVVCDQAIDKTFRRRSSFFDEAMAVHVEMGEPFCPRLRAHLIAAGREGSATVHPRGTYVCMEGPQFSTRAESNLHRSWGADLVGMTCMPEAKLAREAEICYALLAFATDYDCWAAESAGESAGESGGESAGEPAAPRRPTAGESLLDTHCLLDEIRANLKLAASRSTEVLARADDTDCCCRRALDAAIWSDSASMDAARLAELGPLLERVRRG